MAECIKREKVLECIRNYALEVYGADLTDFLHPFAENVEINKICEGLWEATDLIVDIPAADVRPERHGHVVIKSRVIGGVETYKCPQCYHRWQENTRARVDETLCSECGAVLAHSFQNYCPRCGAKMDGEDGDKYESKSGN